MRIKYLKHRGFWLFLLSTALWNAMDTVTAAGSVEFWPSAGFVHDINGPWMLQFKETYYYFFEDSGSDHPKSDISILYKGQDDVYDIGAGFIYVDRSQSIKQESRPYLYMILRGKLVGCELANRAMIEHRDISGGGSYWRFRDKITYNSLFETLDTRGIRLLNSDRLRPYIADEVFLNSNGQGFNQNRVYTGLHVKIVNDIGADVYYLLQTLENNEDRWRNNNIIGAELTLHF